MTVRTNTHIKRKNRDGKGKNGELRMVGQGKALAEESGPEQVLRRRGDAEPVRGRGERGAPGEERGCEGRGNEW